MDEQLAKVLPLRGKDQRPRRPFQIGAAVPTTRFGQSPLWLLRRTDVSFPAKAVYAALVNFKGSNEFAHPSYEQLAEAAGASPKQVKDALRQLRAHGLIEAHRRGLGKSNVYSFPPPPDGWIEVEDLTKAGREDAFKGHPLPRYRDS